MYHDLIFDEKEKAKVNIWRIFLMERKGRIHGYYYDETQWSVYEDEDGYIEMREMEDDNEQSD